jgi:hypothetical protein
VLNPGVRAPIPPVLLMCWLDSVRPSRFLGDIVQLPPTS